MYRFNIYSWVLFIIYLTVVTTMEYFSYKFSLESIYFSLPLMAAFIFWSERTILVIQKPDGSITKTERFKRDLFLISFSFISGHLLSLLFQYNNSDALGWWPLAIYFISAFGILFAIIFSLIAMMLNNHKKYTLIYSITIILTLIFISLMMHLDSFSFFARSETFYIIFLLLGGIHLLLCLGYKAIYVRFFN
ncbi:MAG: hypothetical protein K2Q14_04185 [Gammaproteobacteria bacterium]|nr:hypothetical protein [Gammaproteobacteria bacterium]